MFEMTLCKLNRWVLGSCTRRCRSPTSWIAAALCAGSACSDTGDGVPGVRAGAGGSVGGEAGSSANTMDAGMPAGSGGDRSAEGGTGGSATGACPEAPLPLTLQAESAELRGLDVETDWSGYEGEGHIAGFDAVGDQIAFEFCTPKAGYYTLRLRYANGTGETASRTLAMDGVILPGPHRFPSRWSWNEWEPESPSSAFRESVRLEAGTHRLRVSFEAADTGLVAFDSLTVQAGAAPSSTSITSMLINDWDQLVAGVFASRLFPADDTEAAPRIGELRWRGDWRINHLDVATGYLRDDNTQKAYTDFSRAPLNTSISLDSQGVLDMRYLNWGDEPLPVAINKRHAAVPEQGLLVVQYDVINRTDANREVSLLEYVDLNRTGERSSGSPLYGAEEPEPVSGDLSVTWREDLQAFIADFSQLHGTYLVVGALQTPDQLATGPVGGGAVTLDTGEDLSVDGLIGQFEGGSALVRNESFQGQDAELGMLERLALEPGGQSSIAYFYAVRGDLASAESVARLARENTAESWLRQTGDAFRGWLEQRKPLELQSDTAESHQAAYERALLSIKHSQQPELGSFVAATNPTYQFKVWPRDASVVAMGLDAAGYPEEAESYWRWMASVQETGENPDFPAGTWWTNYSYWQADVGIPFVQPEWDSLGLFTIGVYRHYLELLSRDQDPTDFLDATWPAVERAASFIADNIEDNGFGPADFSIWEDRFQYAMFTQVTYASGLDAAARLAEASGRGEGGAQGFRAARDSIREAILAPYDQSTCRGLWNPDGQYFMRGIDPDCTADRRVDASTDLAWVFGLLPADSDQSKAHRATVLDTLTPNDYGAGIARYEDDGFYYTSIYSPGGVFESTVPETTWPQMSMYMSMAEHWLGETEVSEERLDWYVSVTGQGFMPPGEGVDWATQQPLVSTAVEPVTGTWYLLARLVASGLFDPRLATTADSP